jgi:hypothetical protein
MSKPKEILVAFISDPSWQTISSLLVRAEKPKMGELQMDWLRSEDLKEEKNVTAPVSIIAVKALYLGVPFAVVTASALAAVGQADAIEGGSADLELSTGSWVSR